MTRVVRELVVTYGSYVINGTAGNDRLLDGYIRVNETPDVATVEFDFVIAKSTEALFAAEVAAVEAAFRTPRQALTIVQGATTLYSFSHSGNTGMNSRPTVLKGEDLADTGRSRRYTVAVEFDMPADVHNTDGRRDSTVAIKYTPARRRTVTIAGVYTALGASDALTQYQTNIATYTLAVLTALTGTFEIVGEDAEHDDQNKLVTFSRVFEEIIYNQLESTLDDPAIKNQELRVSRLRQAPGDARTTRRLSEVSVDYAAAIDKDVTTDLVSKYEDDIRPWLIANITNVFGDGDGALVEERPNYDGPENAIRVTMKILAPRGSVLESSLSVNIKDNIGVVLEPIWDGDEGITYYEYKGPRKILRTINETQKILGTNIIQAKFPGAPPFNFKGGGGVGVQAGGAGGAGGGGGGGGFGGFGGFGFQGTNFKPGVRISGLNRNNRKGLRPPRLANVAVAGLLGQGSPGAGVGGGAAGAGGGNAGKPAVAQPPPAQGPFWRLIDTDDTSVPMTLGLEGHQISTTDLITITVEQLIKSPEATVTSLSAAGARARGF